MKKLLLALLLPALIGLPGCSDDDIKRQSVAVSFAAAETGIEADDAYSDVDISLSRTPDASVTVEVDITGFGVEYGTHFTTTPAASNGKVTLTVASGNTRGSIRITKEAGILLEDDEYISMTISEVTSSDDASIGSRSTTKAVFGAILSEGDAMTLEGNEGSEIHANSVYVDFSGNRQTSVGRKSWQLGFWCGEEFRVVLNGSDKVVATPSTKTDIESVDLAEANAVVDTYNLNATHMSVTRPSDDIYDKADGSLEGTAFAEISAVADENMVYFVATEDDKDGDRGNWWKVKVTRNGNGYNVKYGKVSGGTIESIDIVKDEDYNFIFLSFQGAGVVEAEPKAKKWDIKWGIDSGWASAMNVTIMGHSNDYITINNHGGASLAIVMTADITYAGLTADDLADLTFSTDRDAIGTDWRTVGHMGAAGSVWTDRFFVLKDAAGNYYKFRFLRAGLNTEQGGVRGKPELEYALVESGE